MHHAGAWPIIQTMPELLTILESPDANAKPKRPRAKFLTRYILPSDSHGFVGRIFGLSIVSLHFDSYEALAKHPDCKYAIDVNGALTRLVTRVESLNLAGNMLWPSPVPENFKAFPLSRHEWLTASADVFLMRYVSVVDCALLLVNEVHEFGIDLRACTLKQIKRHGAPAAVTSLLEDMLADQGRLRIERNARIHHGNERPFTQDDTTFKIGSIFEHRSDGITGKDRFGRRIDLPRMFREGLVEIQREFNCSTRKLVRQLDRLYEELWKEFEARFDPRIRASTHCLNANRNQVS